MNDKKTFLNLDSDSIKFVDGIRHDKRTFKENDEDGFDYHKCRKVEYIHSLGTVYLFEGWGYVANGYDWWRFKMADLKVLFN